MNRATRQAIGLLKQARSGAYSLAQSQIDQAIALLSPRKASAKAKATRARKRAEQAVKRAERLRKSMALHEKAMRRPGHDCELGEHGWVRERVHLHHLKAGSAKRVTEALHNLIRACDLDHDAWHTKGPEAFREQVMRWCAANGYPVPPVFLRAPHAQVPAPQAPGAVSGGEK